MMASEHDDLLIALIHDRPIQKARDKFSLTRTGELDDERTT